MKHKRRPYSLWLLVALLVILALGALGGGAALILKPDGSIMQWPVTMLEATPFSS